jgi:hypothetical protein
VSAATNSTGEYLKLHVEAETEGSRSPQQELPAVDGFEVAIDQTVHSLAFGPRTTVQAIARICAWLSTPEREVYARIEHVDGKPVAYLVRGNDKHFLPTFPGRQAG